MVTHTRMCPTTLAQGPTAVTSTKKQPLFFDTVTYCPPTHTWLNWYSYSGNYSYTGKKKKKIQNKATNPNSPW